MDPEDNGDDELPRNLRSARVEVPANAASSSRPAASRQDAGVGGLLRTDLDDGFVACPFVSGIAVVSL